MNAVQPEPHRGGQEQIQHIRQAAEHLHAAGMFEQAEDLMREAERRQKELERDREGHPLTKIIHGLTT